MTELILNIKFMHFRIKMEISNWYILKYTKIENDFFKISIQQLRFVVTKNDNYSKINAVVRLY